MEFAGVDKTARSKMGVWKMQEWTYRHDVAEVDNAGVDISARYGKGGQCGRNNTVTKAAYKISRLEVKMIHYTYSQI